MKQTMDKQDDRLLREALGRRADKVPALSDDFEERVLAKLQAHAASPKPLSISPLKGEGQIPQKTEGEGLRCGGWRTWAWVASVAAILVIGYFVFQRETPSPLPPRGEGIVPNVPSMVAETSQSSTPSPQGVQGVEAVSSTPSPRGGQGKGSRVNGASSIAMSPSPRGGQGKGSRANGASSIAISPSPRGGQREGAAATAPTLADLYAAIDQMTNEAIEEANRMMAEALVREYTDDEPS